MRRLLGPHRDPHPALFRKFDRIADQIAESLTQTKVVPDQFVGRIAGYVKLESQTLCLSCRAINIQTLHKGRRAG